MFKTKREARLNLNVNYLCYALRALVTIQRYVHDELSNLK